MCVRSGRWDLDKGPCGARQRGVREMILLCGSVRETELSFTASLLFLPLLCDCQRTHTLSSKWQVHVEVCVCVCVVKTALWGPEYVFSQQSDDVCLNRGLSWGQGLALDCSKEWETHGSQCKVLKKAAIAMRVSQTYTFFVRVGCVHVTIRLLVMNLENLARRTEMMWRKLLVTTVIFCSLRFVARWQAMIDNLPSAAAGCCWYRDGHLVTWRPSQRTTVARENAFSCART